MAVYTHQAAATQRFGITFRSKLEASWAYWLTENNVRWDYVDGKCFDFTIFGDIPLEIKPASIEFLEDAILRYWNNTSGGAPFAVACGEPDLKASEYSLCAPVEEPWVLVYRTNILGISRFEKVLLSCARYGQCASAFNVRTQMWHSPHKGLVPFEPPQRKRSIDCRELIQMQRALMGAVSKAEDFCI